MTATAKQAAKSWSSTLRLPKSSFPARPAPEDTAKYLHRCTDDLYSWQRRGRPATDTFTLHDGPPYANGSLHVGHALNKILKDIVCRTQLARGKRVSYVPGWDCHGLPIELKALEHHGWRKNKSSDGQNAVRVREAARNFAQDVVHEQMRDFKSWGVMGDWDGHWKTMDKDFELRQLSVFMELARKGLIYRRKKPVYWSPSSGSALAEAELEYREDHVSTAALVKFPLMRHPFGHDGGEAISAVIWTTTPWTIPANQAIAIREDLEYTVVRSPNHGNLLLATSCLESVRKMLNEDLHDVQSIISGSKLLGALPRYRSLFDPNASDRPMINADFVKSDAGTGLVHCAPGHGMEDYHALLSLIEKHQIELLVPVDDQGCFTRDAAPSNPCLLEGQNVLTDGNRTVLDLLRGQQALLKSYNYTHSSPYDWRTKQPVIIRATAQWFADVSSIREDAVTSLQKVKFVPAGARTRLTSFAESRSEWCISRQRAWGVPIPSLYRASSGEAVLTPTSIKHIIATISQRGVDAWWSDHECDSAWIAPQLLEDGKADDFRRGADTMDVWFDSGTSWSQLSYGNSDVSQPLADVYLEGSDQHRGWFQSSLLTRVGHQNATQGGVVAAAPFRSLITHGFTLDEKGRKMSKSEGNVIEPNEIIRGLATDLASSKKPRKNSRPAAASLGPDALRMWVASGDFTKDVIVSNTVIKNVHAALRKYRVTFKLLLGALEGFHPQDSIEYGDLGQINQIALHQLWHAKQIMMTAYHAYEFHQVVREISRWVNTDFSGLYIEAIKDVLYCDDIESPERRAVQTALYHIWTELQAILAPFIPLLIEESWQHAPQCVKVGDTHPLRHQWTPSPAEWHNNEIEALLPTYMATNRAVKAGQERARADKLLGSSLGSFVTLLAPDCASGRKALAAWQGSAMGQILVVSDLRSHFGGNEEVSRIESQLQSRARGPQTWAYSEPIELPDGARGWAVVQQAESSKCERCWRYRADGQAYNDDLATSKEQAEDNNNVKKNQLCVRCAEVVTGLKKRNVD